MTTPMKDWPMTDMVFFLRTSPPWTKPAAGVCSMTKVVAQSILKSGVDAARDDLANVSIPSWNAGTRNQFRVHRVGPQLVTTYHAMSPVSKSDSDRQQMFGVFLSQV